MRIARVIQPTAVHHIISRFVDRSWELRDESERQMYLRRLGDALDASDWRCLAYALMSSHIHLALVAGQTPLGSLLKRVHSPFANWLNKRHDRLGSLFAERPAAWAIPEENEARLIAYIHSNPVRGGAVSRASDSSWTSHRAYIGAAPSPPWLHTADGLRRCGVAAAQFDAWVVAAATELDRPALDGVRRAAHRFGAIEIGTPTSPSGEVPLVRRPYAHLRASPRWIVEAVADALKIEPSRFCSRAQQPALVRARQITLAAATRIGLTTAETAAALGITRQSGSRLGAQPLDESARALALVIGDRFSDVTGVTPSPEKPVI